MPRIINHYPQLHEYASGDCLYLGQRHNGSLRRMVFDKKKKAKTYELAYKECKEYFKYNNQNQCIQKLYKGGIEQDD